jgi:hypothetical protein
MKRLEALPAALLLLAGCVEQSELLSPPDAGGPHFDFCPTSIDVFGGADVLLPYCNGPFDLPADPSKGWFSPGDPTYDQTLAGRLQMRFAGDPDLAARFGATWTVRACASPFADLTALADPIAADECGFDQPDQMGGLVGLCSASPAPLAVLLLDGTRDRCHGGGPDSMEPDDPLGYQAHVAQRLESFRADHKPSLLLAGPRTEWRPAPMGMVPGGDRCRWDRVDWDRGGLEAWTKAHPDVPGVIVEPDLHDESKRHHDDCCMELGVACQYPPWYGRGPNESALNCYGAQALVDFWFERLRRVLLAATFTCSSQ